MRIKGKLQRLERTNTAAGCDEQWKAYRIACYRRDRKHPDLALELSMQKLIALGLKDGDPSEAKRRMAEIEEALGPSPKKPDCTEPGAAADPLRLGKELNLW